MIREYRYFSYRQVVRVGVIATNVLEGNEKRPLLINHYGSSVLNYLTSDIYLQ